MAFHIDNFGAFADGLRRFADQDGYVPEAGDRKEAFKYPANSLWLPGSFSEAGVPYDEEQAEEAWREFVAEAHGQTHLAQQGIDDWVDADEQEEG